MSDFIRSSVDARVIGLEAVSELHSGRILWGLHLILISNQAATCFGMPFVMLCCFVLLNIACDSK